MRPLRIGAHLRHLTKAGAQAIEKSLVNATLGWRERIEHPQAVPSRRNQIRPSQVSQMPGGGRLRDTQGGHHVPDTELPAREQVENPKSGAIGERSKQEADAIRARGSHRGGSMAWRSETCPEMVQTPRS